MDTRTGEIRYFREGEEVPPEYVEVTEPQMTASQKELMQVSKFDSRSELGQVFTGKRRERRRKMKDYQKHYR